MANAPNRRKAVKHLIPTDAISERRACRLLGLSRSSLRCAKTRDPQDWLRTRSKDISRSRVRYGYKRIHANLRREGFLFKKKRIRRLYCLEILQLRPKRPRRNVSASHRKFEQIPSTRINDCWAMDFVADLLQDGRKMRILTVTDTFTRECLATTVGPKLKS